MTATNMWIVLWFCS